MAYVDAQDRRRVAAQVVAAVTRLRDTGFPQDERGAAAMRAYALLEVLEAVADEMKHAGLGHDGRVSADMEMLSQMRHLVDETVASLVQPG